MIAFASHEGMVAPLDRVDVDTDQIIPKQFLKRIERTGYGQFLFHDWRNRPDGTPDPDFVLNRPEHLSATVLVTGRNFGCGSSREHAAWALLEHGFRAVISSGFADIFKSNCYQNGLLPVELSAAEVAHVMASAQSEGGCRLTVDLEAQEVRDEDNWSATFSIDPFQRRCLLEGLDDIALTLQHEARIDAYEKKQAQSHH